MFNLEALKEALAPIHKLSELTLSFKVDSTHMQIRLLTPDEELEAMEWSREILKDVSDEDRDFIKSAKYFDRFRIGCLSYSLFQVGDQIFESYIETGETLDNGTPITLPTYEVLRDEMMTWSRALIERIFAKYGELIELSEKKASEAIETSVVDLESEIETLEEKLKELKAQKEAEEQTGQDIRAKHLHAAKSLQDVMSTQDKESKTAPPAPRPKVQEPEPELTPQQKQHLVQQAVEKAVNPEPIMPQQAPPPVRRTQAPPPQQAHEEEVYSSFIDTNDPEQVQAAMLHEAQRLQRQRQQAQAEPIVAPNRKAPHANAALLSHEIESTASQIGNLNNPNTGEQIPVYSLNQPQVISSKMGREPNKPSVGLDSTAKRPVNPKFKKPNR